MKPAALVLATALALSASACGGDDDDKDPASTPTGPSTSLVSTIEVGTVEGRLVSVGGPEDGSNRVLAGRLTITGPQGSVLNADIGSDGRFAIQLAPGEYRLTATSEVHLEGKGVCTTDPEVTVLAADKTVRTDVLCRQD